MKTCKLLRVVKLASINMSYLREYVFLGLFCKRYVFLLQMHAKDYNCILENVFSLVSKMSI